MSNEGIVMVSDKAVPLHQIKILILDFDDIRNPLLNAGQAKSTFEIGQRLANKGYQITIISSRFPGYDDRREEGLIYKHIGLGSRYLRVNNLIYNLSLPFVIRHFHADLILECFTPPCSTLLTPLLTLVPVVAKPTSYEADRFSKKYHLPFTLVERYGSKVYRYFIPSNPYAEAKMRKYNPTVISKIIPEGVGDEFFLIKRKEPRHFLFLGRLDMGQKGIDLLLNAYRKIAASSPYPLVIAGHGPDETAVKETLTALNLQDKVTLLGPTYGDKKAEVLSHAVGIMIPSRYEGFCLFALEAMAAGVPVVAFDIPGLSWTTPQAVLKAKPYDVNEYAVQIKKLFNLSLSHTMGIAARQFAKQYTWDTVAQEYDTFFQEIIAKEAYGNLKAYSPKSSPTTPINSPVGIHEEAPANV